jgi:NAD(P)-dependent dehydrogenase (short-subunit alcohol dehydrogenase family)
VPDIKDKVAIVTGAGRGIGRGIALCYARAGACVVVASRTRTTVEGVVAEIQSEGGEALGITCDVGDREQVFAMVEQTVREYGAVDILVNNAQSFAVPGKTTTSGRQPLETFDESQAGIEGFAGYGAAKEGIRALSRTAAREWGKFGINVNVINPAVRSDSLIELERVDPDMMRQVLKSVPLGRYGDPIRDAGPLAVFLASKDADFITGMTIMLDGGSFMSP